MQHSAGVRQVWSYLGELTEHQASLISERFKYTDRQLQRTGGPAPGSRRLERRGPDAESVGPSEPEDEPVECVHHLTAQSIHPESKQASNLSRSHSARNCNTESVGPSDPRSKPVGCMHATVTTGLVQALVSCLTWAQPLQG